MTVTQRRAALDDDADRDLYDPKYFPRKVVRDGKGIRVPIFLTDSAPPTRPALFDYARDAYRNYAYQPHFFVGDSADPLAAARSYLDAAYRTMPSGTGGAAKTTAPPADEPDGESARDAYIRHVSNAWRRPPGQPDQDDADAIERQREAWAKPGAKPGANPGPGYGGDARTRQTNDAAVADRDQAHREYLDRITNAWRRP